MSCLIHRALLAMLILSLVLTEVACGARDAREDIPPAAPVEAQTIPGSSPTPELEPTAELLREIVEPVSPVSPALPLNKPAMAPANQAVQPIPGSEAALAAAIAHLSQQTGVPANEIRLISVEARKWSDASLGCPQEGFMYAQVITPGYLIILEAQGQGYEYHTDQQANVVLCQG